MARRVITIFVTCIVAVTVLVIPRFANADWPANSIRIGQEQHPQIVAHFGGVIQDAALAGYVRSVGLALVAHTDHSGDPWTFTVLDSPVVNAFAVSGGYVYVTRGLLAIANNEAELAGVLGHEIGHVTAGHGEDRLDQSNKAGLGVLIGTVLGGIFGGAEGAEDAIRLGATIASGYLAQHSQQQEFEADQLGIRLIVKSGYNPHAQADFLDQLAAKEALESEISGRQYNPNRVDFFASHPATGHRVREAIAAAESSGLSVGGGQVHEQRYLARIEGMVYGDTAKEGFIRGLTFSHPELGFTFTVPDGFILQNAPTHVRAANRNGAEYILDSDAPFSGRLDDYVQNRWYPALAQQAQIRWFDEVRATKVHGLDAAIGTLEFATPQGPKIAQVTAIRLDGQIFRITAIAPKSDGRTRNALNSASQSFRALSQAEIDALGEYQIRIRTVKSGDTVGKLAATLPLPKFRDAIFRAMNGYETDADLRAGDLVKVIQ